MSFVIQRSLSRSVPKGQSCQVACPRCNRRVRSKLLGTRQGAADSIRRERECLECGAHFSTYERVEERRPMSQGEVRELIQVAFAKISLALEKMR